MPVACYGQVILGNTSGWGLLPGVCQFLNFSNRTIIKRDICKNVNQHQKAIWKHIDPLKFDALLPKSNFFTKIVEFWQFSENFGVSCVWDIFLTNEIYFQCPMHQNKGKMVGHDNQAQ